MKTVPALVRAMRPQQWVKNLFVFAPLLFSHEWTTKLALRVCAVFGIFCLLSSGVYLMNDVVDREKDRLHPKKRTRPIASGELGVGVAVAVAVTLVAAAFTWSRAPFGLASNGVALVCAAYLVIQILYSFWLKRVVIVDVMCIASGFVLRLIVGGSAAWVEESAWILVCTIFLSLFLALCKRRHEVVSLGDDAASHRSILADYPPALLDQLITAATACILVTYALYTVDERTATAHRLLLPDGRPSAILAVTVPFVVFGVFRYLFLVHRRDVGGSPTDALLRDVPTIVNGVLFMATVLVVFRLAAH